MNSRYEEDPQTTSRTCGECGNLVTTAWHRHTFQYGSGTDAVDLDVRLPVRRCDHCDFDYLDDEGERIKHEAVCRYLGVLTPREIRGIRKRHGLSRQAFARVTGIGEASLGRWENGFKIQTLGNDRYLRLLAHPGILALLQNVGGEAPLRERSRSTFRQIEVSARLLECQRSFSLRLAA